MRVSALLLLLGFTCLGCDCIEASVQSKADHADVIFRGTIVKLRKSSKPASIFPGLARHTKKVAVFRVARVWKGQVGQTFEMPGIIEVAACVGFERRLLRVGEDLLVYASRSEGSEYLTGICGDHKRAKDADEDFRVLGPGYEARGMGVASAGRQFRRSS